MKNDEESKETYWRRKFYHQQLVKLRECHLKLMADPAWFEDTCRVSADVWEELEKKCEEENRNYDWLLNTWSSEYMIAFGTEDFRKASELELEFYKFWGCPIRKETLNPKEFFKW